MLVDLRNGGPIEIQVESLHFFAPYKRGEVCG